MTTTIETLLENDFGGYARISGDDEFESFANDLAVYACKWTPRCQNAIVVHARELFEDATMRELVDMYAKAKAGADKSPQSKAKRIKLLLFFFINLEISILTRLFEQFLL